MEIYKKTRSDVNSAADSHSARCILNSRGFGPIPRIAFGTLTEPLRLQVLGTLLYPLVVYVMWPLLQEDGGMKWQLGNVVKWRLEVVSVDSGG